MRVLSTIVLAASAASALKLYPRQTELNCPARDSNGDELTAGGDPGSDGITCVYGDNDCVYGTDGSLETGDSACPELFSESDTTPSTTLACPSVDKDDSPLEAQGGPDSDGLSCIYESAGRCDYSADGKISDGTSSCPDTASAASATTSSGRFATSSAINSMTTSSIITSTTRRTSTERPTNTADSGPANTDIPDGEDAAAGVRPGLLITAVLGVAAGFALMF